MKKYINTNLLTGILIGIILSIATISILHSLHHEGGDKENKYIKKYYETEVATNISAHGLRKKINTGDNSFILVDVRSEEEYLEGHIIGAINIPAYTNRDNTQNISNERILESFKALGEDKQVITYCYSAYCMTSRKMGKYLAENGVYVKHLTVGWNEWRYGWKLWNYPHETDETEKYIASGEEPGKLEGEGSDSCGISGDFGC